MPDKRTASFDTRTFLAKLQNGKSGQHYGDRQVIFSQGDPADAVFYIQTGKVKMTVLSKQGKEVLDVYAPSSQRYPLRNP